MQFLVRALLAAIAMSGALTAGTGNAQAPAQGPGAPSSAAPASVGIIARVNGVAIPESRFEAMLMQQVAAGTADSPELRAQIRDLLINQEVLTQAAVMSGIEQDPETAHQMALVRQELLANAYLREELGRMGAPSDEILKKEYDAIVGKMEKTEYKARHILVATEDEARTIIAELQKGAQFEVLAERSRDAVSAANGGDLGWIALEQLVQPVAEAVRKLQKGQVTQAPVQSQFGWHVIRIDDMRERQITPFEQVKPQLAQQVQRDRVQRIVQDLRSKAKID